MVKLTLQVQVDIDISYEESNTIREKFVSQYNVRELKFIPNTKELDIFEGNDIKFETVDQIVLQQIDTIESDIVDKTVLSNLYRDIII